MTTERSTVAIQANYSVHWPVKEGDSGVGELVNDFDGNHNPKFLGECLQQLASRCHDLRD